jgi:hypothetical protein
MSLPDDFVGSVEPIANGRPWLGKRDREKYRLFCRTR